MGTLKVLKFDAVFTINAIGYVTKADFEKKLCVIHENLNEGGIYIFDIFNKDAMTQFVADYAYQIHKKVGILRFFRAQCSTIDRERDMARKK